jgi:uncharacterized membrane protein YfcA
MILEALAVGVAAGVVAGLLGVGGGILFVPGLTLLLSLHQVDAEATSLVAIIPVALVGAWRQHRYGNVRVGDGVVIGVLSVAGAVAGAELADVLPEDVLRAAFAALMILVAAQLVHRAWRQPATEERPPGE